MTRRAFICNAVRTPFGRFGSALAGVRAEDLGAVPLAALMTRNTAVDWQAVSEMAFMTSPSIASQARHAGLEPRQARVALRTLRMRRQVSAVEGGICTGD